MTPEDIARRFERRQGYELIDYAEVALPLYRLTVDAVTMVHREIPPIKEFVMRSIAAGLSSQQELGAFLGLDGTIIGATMAQLRDDRYAIAADDGTGAILLDRGREVLAKARESAPQDEMLVFLYDRLLRRPVWLGTETLLSPSDVNVQREIEIRPYPADGPEIADLPLREVSQVLQRQFGGRSEFGKDLLRIKRIVRRLRLYRPAVALVYKKSRGPDIQIAFIVDDARHEGLEHAFAERGGPKKMGFVRSIDESATAAALRRHLGSDVQSLLPDPDALEEQRLKISTARLKYQIAVKHAERADGGRSSTGLEASRLVQVAEQALTEAEDAMRRFPARPIAAYEIPELLTAAVTGCNQLLAISSRDAGAHVVDKDFLRKIEAILARGVRVVITLGDISAAATLTVNGGSSAPAVELEKLGRKYANLELRLGIRGEFYHVIRDKDFAVVCNRPMLGNRGKVRTFHHVVGYLLQAPELVDAYADRVTGRVGRAATPFVGADRRPK